MPPPPLLPPPSPFLKMPDSPPPELPVPPSPLELFFPLEELLQAAMLAATHAITSATEALVHKLIIGPTFSFFGSRDRSPPGRPRRSQRSSHPMYPRKGTISSLAVPPDARDSVTLSRDSGALRCDIPRTIPRTSEHVRRACALRCDSPRAIGEEP